MADTKAELLAQARVLYAQRVLMQEIADSLGISLRTLHRWKAADAKAGLDWDGRRAERDRQDPHVLIRILEDRLATVAAAEIKNSEAGAWADTLQKISNVLNRERERVGDLSVVLGVLSGLAAWVHEHLSDEDLRDISRIIDAYLSDLKEQSL